MERDDLLAFLRAQKWAVEASVSVHGTPQAAVIGVAVTDDLEIVFDTSEASRKTANLRRNPRAALVVGWDDARTVQLEGLADEPRGAELERLKSVYFARFPDGPERAAREPLTYFRVRPRWVRVSDFTGPEPKVTVVELSPKRPAREARATEPEVPPAPAVATAEATAPDTLGTDDALGSAPAVDPGDALASAPALDGDDALDSVPTLGPDALDSAPALADAGDDEPSEAPEAPPTEP